MCVRRGVRGLLKRERGGRRIKQEKEEEATESHGQTERGMRG